MALTREQFRYGFGNALAEQESDELFERWAIPSPGGRCSRPPSANFTPHSPAKVNTNNSMRGPLLVTAGGRDHTVPASISHSTVKQYRKSRAPRSSRSSPTAVTRSRSTAAGARSPTPSSTGSKSVSSRDATTKSLKVEKLAPTVGAEVLDVDLNRIRNDEDLPGAVMEALEEHGILAFRGLNIDDGAQVAFCRKLGEVVSFPSQKIPEIFKVTLDKEKNPVADYLKGTFFWHIDGATDEIPTKASLLTARQIADGGDTEFASTYAAYEELSDEEKERFEGSRAPQPGRPPEARAPDPTPEELNAWRVVDEEHPLAWTHTAAGSRSLSVRR